MYRVTEESDSESESETETESDVVSGQNGYGTTALGSGMA